MMNGGVDEEVELDFDRRRRIDLDEAVFAQSKSVPQLELIFATARARRASLLITRLTEAKMAALDAGWQAQLDYCPVSQTAFLGVPQALAPGGAVPGQVGIVAAGSSDAPVAREAARTLQFNGVDHRLLIDVGVAGLWRLTRRLDELRECPVLIVVAGMDAALPTVLGGLVPSLIIAVPTSVGYGVADGGRTALHAILASCAPGIAAVNIDNGYGAACAAMRALRLARPSCTAAAPASSNSILT
jgi:NCAIR mutase (PurE)-related protein